MGFETKMLTLYAITDRRKDSKEIFYKKISDALEGGITILQLREKELDDQSFINEAIDVKKLCEKYNVPLIINDRVEVALKSGADGVHVGIEDTPVSEIRQTAPKGFIIGATAKTLDQAKKAFEQGADYLGVGAVFPSPTKKNAVRITPQMLTEISSSVDIPTVGIGGITYENADILNGTGVSGIAVVSAIFSAENVKKAAADMLIKAKNIISIQEKI